MSVRQTFLFDDGPEGGTPAITGDLIESTGAVYSAANTMHGAFGLLGNGIGNRYVGVNDSGAINHSGSLYVKPLIQPDGSNRVLNFMTASSTVIFAIRINSNGHFQLVRGIALAVESAMTWVSGQWYRMDWQYSQTVMATPTLSVRLFSNPSATTPDETLTDTQSGVTNNFSKWRIGLLSNSAAISAAAVDTFRISDGAEWIGPYATPVTGSGKGRVWNATSSTWMPFTPKPYVGGVPVTAKAKIWDQASSSWKTTHL